MVLTHLQPLTSDTSYSVLPQVQQELLEKPSSKEDNLRMLLDLNGNVCQVVTGVSVGQSPPKSTISLDLTSSFPVFPILTAPGYQIKFDSRDLCVSSLEQPFYRSIDERTLVYFADNSKQLLEAYVESGEGIDRAGGFAVQVTVTYHVWSHLITAIFKGFRRDAYSKNRGRLSQRRGLPGCILFQITGAFSRGGTSFFGNLSIAVAVNMTKPG